MVFAALMDLLVGVSHHLEFCSPAVARAVMVCHIFCSSLSHVGIAVFVQSFRSFYSLHFFTHTATPTPRKSCHSFAHCVPFHSFHFQGICLFPPCKSMWLQPCSASLHTASPPHTSTLTVHSLQYTPFVHYFQPLLSPPAPFEQKNAPNQLPAAPVHRAPRFLCPGHSLHSQRLAHNAQASYFVPFLFTRISALLSTLAQGCFYYSV